MFNEGTWIFISFIVFIGLTFVSLKRIILSTLDKKIHEVSSCVTIAESTKVTSHDMLIELKKEYQRTHLQCEQIIHDAKIESQTIISETEAKIVMLNTKSLELFEDYKKQSETAALESLKADIIITVLQMLESENKHNTVEQLKAVENGISIIKKIWN